jgi:hypothetical protein
MLAENRRMSLDFILLFPLWRDNPSDLYLRRHRNRNGCNTYQIFHILKAAWNWLGQFQAAFLLVRLISMG